MTSRPKVRQIQILVYLAFLPLVALAASVPLPDKLLTLQSLSDGQAEKSDDRALQNLAATRNRTQQETAHALGASHGLIWQNERIKRRLNALKPTLNSIFNFAPLMVDKHIVPPVIIRARGVSLQKTDAAVRQTGIVLKIKQKARIAGAPPIWERYLLIDLSPPPVTPSVLLPNSAAERAAWAAWIAEGWQQGIRQADAIFADNLHRLRRDLTGMLRYHLLVGRGYISSPFLNETDNGAVIEDDTLRIDDKVLMLVRPAAFASPDTWLPVFGDQALRPYTRWPDR